MTYQIIQTSLQVASRVPGVSPQNIVDTCTSIYNFVLAAGSTSSTDDVANRDNAFASLDCALGLNSVGEDNFIDQATAIYALFSSRPDPA